MRRDTKERDEDRKKKDKVKKHIEDKVKSESQAIEDLKIEFKEEYKKVDPKGKIYQDIS
jgi:hypothetical protein